MRSTCSATSSCSRRRSLPIASRRGSSRKWTWRAGVAHGACRLPNDAGLIYKVLGRETAQVKAKVREFWGIVREEVTGASIPPPYFWR